MANVDLSIAVKKDWELANPWLWLGAGFGLALWSWLWTLTYGPYASDARVLVLAIGVLATSIGLWLRWNDRHTIHLLHGPALAPVVGRLAMGGLFGAIAVGVTALLVLTYVQWDGIDWKPGATTLIWLSVVPLSWCAARRCLKQRQDRLPIDADEEIGLAFAITGVICFIGSMTLYLGPDWANEWDSMRMFLRVMMAVALMASALMLVSLRVRRLVLGFLFLLHFGGISTAALSAPPSPALIQQIWVRIYRPYLEFVYLNNAYHFYAPEPGPAKYHWFRVIYKTDDGKEVGLWYKMPEFDDKGKMGHTVALEYQRFLAMTETAEQFDPTPVPMVTDAKPQPLYHNRLMLVPGAEVKLGDPAAQSTHFHIPLHPLVTPMQQIWIPNANTKRLLASYAKFVAHKFAHNPDDFDGKLTLQSVKVYRVVHMIVPPTVLLNGLPPTDPELYRPFYLGNHKPDGTLINDHDPYLYWLLPILRANGNDPNSEIMDFCRLHAGDSHWVRAYGSKDRWIEQDPPKQGNVPFK